MEAVDDVAVPHLGGADLDDVARRGVVIGGLEIEGHVLLERAAELARVEQLQRLEEGERESDVASVRRRQHEVALPGLPADHVRREVPHAGGRQHPAQGYLEAAPRFDHDPPLGRDGLLQALGQPDGLRQRGGVGELVVPFLERVAVWADALGQQLPDERGK